MAQDRGKRRGAGIPVNVSRAGQNTENFLTIIGTISAEMKLTVMLDQLWAARCAVIFNNLLINVRLSEETNLIFSIKLCGTFLKLKRIQIVLSQVYTGFHVMCVLFFSDFKQTYTC